MASARRRHSDEERSIEAEEWLYAEGPETVEVDWARSGKWLVYCTHPYFDEVWGKLKTATERGELGHASKIRNPANPLARVERALVACVYTADYEDLEDVRRVLAALRNLGFEKATLQYKRDSDTLAGSYGTGTSLYVSRPGSRDFECT